MNEWTALCFVKMFSLLFPSSRSAFYSCSSPTVKGVMPFDTCDVSRAPPSILAPSQETQLRPCLLELFHSQSRCHNLEPLCPFLRMDRASPVATYFLVLLLYTLPVRFLFLNPLRSSSATSFSLDYNSRNFSFLVSPLVPAPIFWGALPVGLVVIFPRFPFFNSQWTPFCASFFRFAVARVFPLL